MDSRQVFSQWLLIAFSLLVFTSTSALAQTVAYGTAGSLRQGPIGQGYNETPAERLGRYEKSYRLMLSVDRKVLVYKGNVSEWLDSANYDMMTNEVIESSPSGENLFYPTDVIDGFFYYDQNRQKHHFQALKLDPSTRAVFVEVLNDDGPARVFVRHRIKESTGGGNPSYSTSSSTEPYQKWKEYYYQLSPDDTPVRFTPSRRVAKQIFQNRSPEVMDYLKENPLMNLARINGIVKVFMVYNSMAEE